MKIKWICLLACMLTMFSSCSEDDDDECTSTETSYVSSINAANTGTVGTPLNIEVFFGVYNGCGEFNKFVKNQNGNTTEIEVKSQYEICSICPQVALTLETTYEFTASSPGDYTLKFKSGEDEYISTTISIE